MTSAHTESLRVAAQAPGCFGSPSVYSLDSQVCASCVAYNPCRSASGATLEAIRGVIDISDVMARHAKARLKAQADALAKAPPPQMQTVNQPVALLSKVERKTPVMKVIFDVTSRHEEVIKNLAIKTGELARQQIKQNRLGLVLPALKKGQNLYANAGPKFLRIACDMLLNGGFTRASLSSAMVNQFGWQETTARPHVAQVCGLFGGFNITQEIDGLFTVTPESDCSNELENYQSEGEI